MHYFTKTRMCWRKMFETSGWRPQEQRLDFDIVFENRLILLNVCLLKKLNGKLYCSELMNCDQFYWCYKHKPKVALWIMMLVYVISWYRHCQCQISTESVIVKIHPCQLHSKLEASWQVLFLTKQLETFRIDHKKRVDCNKEKIKKVLASW